MKLSVLGVVLAFALAIPASATVRYFHWDTPTTAIAAMSPHSIGGENPHAPA